MSLLSAEVVISVMNALTDLMRTIPTRCAPVAASVVGRNRNRTDSQTPSSLTYVPDSSHAPDRQRTRELARTIATGRTIITFHCNSACPVRSAGSNDQESEPTSCFRHHDGH